MKLTLSLFAISFLLGACSAHVSGGGTDGFQAPQAKPFVDEVSGGPDISGKWKSSCTDTNFAGQYPKQRIEMDVSGRTVTRVAQQYSDSQCQVPGPATTQQGKFRFVLNKGADTYEVEYEFESGRGFSYRVGENLRLVGSTLYTSNMVSGDADTSTPLYSQSSQSSQE